MKKIPDNRLGSWTPFRPLPHLISAQRPNFIFFSKPSLMLDYRGHTNFLIKMGFLKRQFHVQNVLLTLCFIYKIHSLGVGGIWNILNGCHSSLPVGCHHPGHQGGAAHLPACPALGEGGVWRGRGRTCWRGGRRSQLRY